MDWYSYLTTEFKLNRDMYKSRSRAVVSCPKCSSTDIVRIDHLKCKVELLGFYECSCCRRTESLVRARAKKKGSVRSLPIKLIE